MYGSSNTDLSSPFSLKMRNKLSKFTYINTYPAGTENDKPLLPLKSQDTLYLQTLKVNYSI